MTRKKILISIILFVVAVSGIVLLLFSLQKRYDGEELTESRFVPGTAMEKKVVHLYYGDPENQYLVAEKRAVKAPEDPDLFGRIILKELIGGPRSDLVKTVSGGVGIRAFYIADNGVAYVDFTEEIRTGHPGGVQSELLTLYSVVNSLILNMDQVESVKILIEGSEALTLGGHIDIRFPFKANLLMVR